MSQHSVAYGRFVRWVQEDMDKARITVNQKVFSLVLWSLVMPAAFSVILYGLRKFQILPPVRFADLILFLPPFLYAMVALWPTLKDLPRAFRIGGLGAMLEESGKEVDWREEVAARLLKDIPLTRKEWCLIEFHLSEDIERMRAKNRYLAVLAGAVLFFMYQFLDLGGGQEGPNERGPMGVFVLWAEQFSQWGGQLSAIILFSSLFYLSGIQLQKHLVRYLVCVRRLARFGEE